MNETRKPEGDGFVDQGTEGALGLGASGQKQLSVFSSGPEREGFEIRHARNVRRLMHDAQEKSLHARSFAYKVSEFPRKLGGFQEEKNMDRKKQRPPFPSITVRLPAETMAMIDEAVALTGRSQGSIVNECIEAQLAETIQRTADRTQKLADKLKAKTQGKRIAGEPTEELGPTRKS